MLVLEQFKMLGRYLTQVKHYEKPIRENPYTTFILAHAGALQLDQALDLQKRYKNVVLVQKEKSVKSSIVGFSGLLVLLGIVSGLSSRRAASPDSGRPQ